MAGYLKDEPAAVPETNPRPAETGNAPPGAANEAPTSHQHRERSRPIAQQDTTLNLDLINQAKQESWQEPAGEPQSE